MAGDAPSPGPGSSGRGPDHADSTRSGPPAAPLALYRRYRPASFAEVKGQDHVTEPLRQALRSGRVHHAYLFSGPRGCGKTSSARILARSLNCEQGPTPDPCGVCASCIALAPAGPGSIDVIEIDAASHGGVDDARDLRERAFYSPVSGRYKIYIIDEAHMVTREGFNALLKLVEEPPPHLKFVFATTEPEKVIATIRSRTHHYPFRLVPPTVLREHLEQILASEGVPYEPAVLPIVIRAGAGSVRDALSVLDQLIAGSDETGLRYDRAIALLGYTDDRLLDEVIEAFAADEGAAVFHAIDHVVEAGHDPRRFAADLLDRLRDLIVISAVPDATTTGLIDAPPDRGEEMGKQAAAFGRARLTKAAEIISAGLVEMRGATSPRLLLELMCAQVLLPAAGSDATGLADRVERLERRLSAGDRQATGRAGGAAASGPMVVGSDTSEPGTGTAWPRRKPAGPTAAAAPRAAAPTADPRAAAPTADPQAAAPTADPAAAAAVRTGVPADTDALRTRWPDVLAAVQGRKRVAWMQLSNASVESFTDGVLTLTFAQAGVAKGFLTGGYDKDLGQVLTDMFGVTAAIRTSVAAPSDSHSPDAGRPSHSPPTRPAERSAAPRPAEGQAGRPVDVGRVGGGATDQLPDPGGHSTAGPPQQQASARPAPASPTSAPSTSAPATSAPAASAGGTSGTSVPADRISGTSASGTSVPADRISGTSASGTSVPAGRASGRSAPGASASGGSAPGRSAQAGGTSGRSASGRSASGRSASANSASAGRVSGRSASDRAAPGPSAVAGRTAGRSVAPRAADNEPTPGDLPAPDVLTGTDLIERELGGRVIQELDSP